MKHRRLRIAWSVTWGIVAVLLIALWVRSYWCAEAFTQILSTNRQHGWGVKSSARNFPGNIEYCSDKFTSGSILSTGWRYGYWGKTISQMKEEHPIGFKLLWDKDYKTVRIPHWSAAVLVCVMVRSCAVADHRYEEDTRMRR